MFRLEGDFGSAVFSGGVDAQGAVTDRLVSVPTESALNFFRKLAIAKTNVVANSLGLYSFMRAGRNNKVRFSSIGVPKHLLRPRANGCSWNPVGQVKMNTNEIEVHGIEYQGEQCPDVFFGDCLERLYGVGNDVRDVNSTPEAAALFGELLQRIYLGLGNSFYDLAHFGNHPLITDADTNAWYTVNGVEEDEWENYKAQQATLGGLLTIVDNLKAEGHSNFDVEISKDDIAADNETYTGSATELFDRVLKAQSVEMKTASKRQDTASGRFKSILLVSPAIFEKYEDELTTKFDTIPQQYAYYLDGRFAQAVGVDNSGVVDGVLKYKGHMVVCMDEWDSFDKITGTKTFRAIAVTPGNFGIAYDVADLQQFNGMGLRLLQRLEAPYQGKVFMDTTFRTGVGLVDKDYIVNASLTLTPS